MNFSDHFTYVLTFFICSFNSKQILFLISFVYDVHAHTYTYIYAEKEM